LEEYIIMHRLGFFALAVAFLAGGPMFAGSSSGTRLTTANLGEQPFRFVIAAGESRDDSVRFTVTVQGKQAKAPPAHSVWLSVFNGEVQLVNCRVAEGKREGTVVYEFIVSRKYLVRSKLLLEETDAAQRGVPSGDIYWFYLQDFAHPAPGEKAPKKK
jgi:hypothetical protein